MLKINDHIAKIMLFVLLCTLSGFVGGYFAYGSIDQLKDDSSQTIEDQSYINSIIKDVGQSVVSIGIRSSQVSGTLFGPQRLETSSAGTGFLISDDGYVVTNRHVIPEGSSQITITLSNGKTLENVSVVDTTKEDDPLDIAFLKINDAEGNDLIPIRVGDSNKVEVGDRVIAIGNALGRLQNTVTSGIISGFGRDVTAGSEFNSESLVNLIQTDAAINQGNSGGPLVNMNGEVIGVNTAVAGGDAQNIGFAIPINDLKGSISDILELGELNRPLLGVRYVALSSEIAEENDLELEQGAYLIDTQSGPAIIRGSAADKAGLRTGDIIVAIDGININQRNSIVSILGKYSAGDRISIDVQRGEDKLQLDATLGEF